jgi:CBS domain-containing protein
MTARASLVAVGAEMRAVEADRVARREGVHRLLVVRGGQLVGLVCRCDLDGALSEPVCACMESEIYVIDAGATLGEAATAMHTLDVGCLPVTRGQQVVGIITRGDIIRAGLPEESFASPSPSF